MRTKLEKLSFAKILRKRMTPAENHLWQTLRRKTLGVRVHRQKPKYGYILDFYIPKLMVDIEVDSKSHDPYKDGIRDGHLRLRGIRTLRLSNEFVLSKSGFDLLAAVSVALKEFGRERK